MLRLVWRPFTLFSIIACALAVGWPTRLHAQTAPVIVSTVDFWSADGKSQLLPITINTSSGSPVTASLRVGTRTFPLSGIYPSTNQFFFIGTIGPFNLSENGAVVTLTATNSFGTSTATGHLTVYPALPNFTEGRNPTSTSFTVGFDATLIALAAGSPPITYQWRKDGMNIPGANGATLLLHATTSADAGTYDVVATSPYGTATSSSATLTALYAAATIVQSPQSRGAALGSAVSLQVTAGGSPPLGYQWQKNGTAIAGATQSTFAIASLQESDMGSYRVVVTSSINSVTSAAAEITLLAPAITFTEQPQSATVGVGKAVTFSATANGTAPITYQWKKDGDPVPGATTASLSLSNVQLSAAGVYTITATNAAGAATSQPATLTVVAPPVVAKTSWPATLMLGATTDLQASATGTAPLTYQWRKDGADLPGATTATLTVAASQLSASGAYSVAVSNPGGTIVSEISTLTILLPGRMVNLSVLTALRADDDSFTIGVVLGGAGTSGRKNLLVRAGGPSLAQFGVASPLADPRLTLFAGSRATGENDDWAGGSEVAAAVAQLGAFPFVGASSKDAAILTTADSGANSFRISANGSPTGTVLAEVYDATPRESLRSDTPRLVNLSVLKPIASGLTAGFVVGGNSSVKVLLRAIGPSLTAFGVANFSASPTLALSRENGVVVATNAGWSGNGELAAAMQSVGAFPLPASSKDAALLAVLTPGAYNAEVSGDDGTGAIVLLEIYEVP